MRLPSGKIPSQPLTFLWERHKEIARRLVTGEKPRELAHSMGMSEARLSIITNSPAFQAHLARLSAAADENSKNVQARMGELAVESMTILEQAIRVKNDSISPALKIKVAQDVLDRAGYGAINKSASIGLQLSGTDVEELRKRRDAARAQSAQVTIIDSTATVVR